MGREGITNRVQTDSIVLRLGEREYELVSFLSPGETWVSSKEMVRRAVQLNANLGEDDGRFILVHQDEIPAELRDKIAMVFTAWRRPGLPRHVAYVAWHGRQWVQDW